MATKPSAVSLSSAVLNFSKLMALASPKEFNEGLSWYSKTHSDCLLAANNVGCEFEIFCKLVAILSPATLWQKNIQSAINVYAHFKNGGNADNIPTNNGTRYYANARKAFNLLAGSAQLTPKAVKTYAFYQNIFNPSQGDYITVDFHIYNASLGGRIIWDEWGKAGKISVATQATIQQAIRVVAKIYNVLPLQAQAIIWIVQKRVNPGGYATFGCVTRRK